MGAAVTGPVAAPSTLLLGRWDTEDRLRFIARTIPLTPAAGRELGVLLHLGDENHPWMRRSFYAAWGSKEVIDHRPVTPNLAVGFAGDTAIADGRYRHPIRYLRVRDDLDPEQLPPPGG
ncbi:hypothetical protein GCM10010095_82800 [Streptomyces anthocyanicus]|uniref:Uncharacterized protein n=1 Tax=Streptomyces violaceolatus TaxID=67378 RepID=A0ABN3THN2_9ACTN|nr:hypothetical protein GCM10010095_82800 [Streptomyces anthocyanicus]GHC38759.1 hypothetical protein GCM10010348_77640 [Streptomyces anthocyanicus]